MKRNASKLENWIMVDLNVPTFIGQTLNHTNFHNGFTIQLEFIDLNPKTRLLTGRFHYYDNVKHEKFSRVEEFYLGDADSVWVNTKRF
jgi:hypothetical protein